MIGFNPANEDFVPGFRFLTGGWGPPLFEPFGTSARRVDLLMEVVSRDGMSFTARDHHGVVHECLLRRHDRPDLGRDPRGMRREIVWGGSLPQGPIEQVAAFADLLLLSDYRNPAILLLCASVEDDGTAVCDLVHTARRGGHADWRMDDAELPGVTIGDAWFSDERVRVAPGAARRSPVFRLRPDRPFVADRNPGPGPGWSPDPYAPRAGDLFAAFKFETNHEGPLTILSAHLLRIAGGMDRDSVGRWLPAMPEPTRRSFSVDLPLGTRMDLETEVERAHARSRPDEVIVISVPSVVDSADLNLRSLSHTGIKLHECDSIDDDLYGTDLAKGVWIGEDVSWHDCGEDGAEWDASWRRATRDDLERHGISMEEVAASWEDLAEVDVSEEEVARMVDEDVARQRAEATPPPTAD